ncbi:MAG: hypothetical protein GX219_03890 [Tissierellia bacterium]|nr:hypothetical protein [Tissierellia bacterium]
MKKFLILIVVFIMLVSISISFSEPGSSNDPLVSKSYVDEEIARLSNMIYQSQGQGQMIPVFQGEESTWQVVEVEAGGFLELKGGAELILRSGTAYAVPSVRNGIVNGLSDLTDGVDLVAESQLRQNHHIIVPRSDGRGARCYTKCFFLVKGPFEVK